jgi:hypothetical protein
LEYGEILGFALERRAVDETVGGRNMRVAERREDFCGDFGASFSGGQRAVGGEIVEGESDARMDGGGRMRGRIGGRRLGVGDGGREEERSDGERVLEQTGYRLMSGTEGQHEGSPGRAE